ncbi:MAG: SAM-dependent methyltransferase [Myxococcota bacterium]|jgi:SAM-dependent methyltransferase
MDGFDDPWEHIRLLSDRPRNDRLLELLRRRAPGHSVLEVGCGTGVLSCVAARMGATRVHAVEPSAQAEVARALIAANGLQDQVVLHKAMIEDLEPESVDLAFSELLNAAPFAEGILSASRAASAWVPNGHLAPSRLEVHVALIREGESAREHRDALKELQRLGADFDLDFGPVAQGLAAPGPYTYVSPRVELASAAALLWAADLKQFDDPQDIEISVEVADPGPVGGVAMWFRAVLDEGLEIDNAPGAGGHWGTLIQAWPELVGARSGPFRLKATATETGFEVEPG